ncbi:MAG TPA: alpha-amylase family glycosyl hydrolase [Fimbriimonadaceae bacterium]|nr:alpha-amylase family glycosyl hydrolase [Fimbriimonadaceae bacterium]
MMIATLAALLIQDLGVDHEFLYRADRDLKSVAVAGTFNNWDKKANLMARGADGRTWTFKRRLQPGKHQYKFVLDDENWVTDPKAQKQEDDGNGNINSILILFPSEYLKTPGKKGDGVVTPSAIRHLQSAPDLNFDRGELTLAITVRPEDVAKLEVVTPNRRIPLTRTAGDEILETWRAKVPWNRRDGLKYRFELGDGPKTWVLGANGVREKEAEWFALDPKTFKPFEVPKWVEKTVFYQIFPDRFDNGSAANDPKDVQKWGDEPTYWNRYGGDIAGVERRMGHLVDLGVNAVYFNPVMKAPAYHRYDPVDFYEIDPEFGTNAEFKKLTAGLEKVGIRTVLDQIFDHVGVTFPPFVDVLKNQQKSKYLDYFFIKSFPVAVKQNPPYEAWWGAESMPKVNLAQPELKKYLLDSVNFWHDNATLAGWRLDVANEVPDWFWREFRQRVKGIDPNTWIVGEVWYNAAPWLKGDMWDASMNYPFRDAVLRFVAEGKTTSTQFLNQLMTVYSWTVPQVSRNQLNLISSHDTPRFITLAGNNRKLAAMGAVVQFTWVGAPSVYYGEEIGMEGGADPQNRRGMRWDMVNPNNGLLNLYRRLTHLRTNASVLQSGDPGIVLADDANRVAVFSRTLGNEVAVTALNRSDRAQDVKFAVKDGTGKPVTEMLDGITGNLLRARDGVFSIRLEPLTSFVALKRTPETTTLIKGLARLPQVKEFVNP